MDVVLVADERVQIKALGRITRGDRACADGGVSKVGQMVKYLFLFDFYKGQSVFIQVAKTVTVIVVYGSKWWVSPTLRIN